MEDTLRLPYSYLEYKNDKVSRINTPIIITQHTIIIYNIHVFDTNLELVLNTIRPYNHVYIVTILSFEASRNGMIFELTIKAAFLRKP